VRVKFDNTICAGRIRRAAAKFRFHGDWLGINPQPEKTFEKADFPGAPALRAFLRRNNLITPFNSFMGKA
jgi:hypothetical protein